MGGRRLDKGKETLSPHRKERADKNAGAIQNPCVSIEKNHLEFYKPLILAIKELSKKSTGFGLHVSFLSISQTSILSLSA